MVKRKCAGDGNGVRISEAKRARREAKRARSNVSQKNKNASDKKLIIRKLGIVGHHNIMFPVAHYPRTSMYCRSWTMKSFLHSAEQALLMKDWIRASILLSAAFKYAFAAPQTLIKSEMRGKGPTESFERALYMAVEVLLHLPGGGPVITTLLDGASRVKVVRERARRQAYSVMYQAFDSCCRNRLLPADSILETIKKYSGIRASKANEVYHAQFTRGIIAYARWLKAILAVPKSMTSAADPEGNKIVHFEHAHWAAKDYESTVQGKDVQTHLETALEKTPSMPAFYKVAHYYCVIGEFHAALNSAEKAKEAFPLDADSHTLFLCLKTSFSERKKNRMHINLDIELCKSHIDVLRCDPGCTHAIRSLVGIGEQHNGNWEVQVLVIEGLLYRLDMYPVVPIVKKKKNLTPGIDASPSDMQSWTDLATRLILIADASVADSECLKQYWKPVEQLLFERRKWWKFSIFRSVNSFLFDDDLMDNDKANFVLSVAICAVFILGLETDFYSKLYEVLDSNNRVQHTALLRNSKSNLEKLQKVMAK